MDFINEIKFNEKGLVPAVAQDVLTGQVLMLAYMNEEALEKTIQTGFAHYYSRSRQSLWKKGESSGNIQTVKQLCIDCDKDTILLKVEQKGPACHTGEGSCFYREVKDGIIVDTAENTSGSEILEQLYNVIVGRKANRVEGSYTNYLFDKGIDKILKKVGEETTEVVIAAKNPENEELVYEISDLFYHLTVLMVEKGVSYEEIYKELAKRSKK